jgi:ketopantoate reductase
MRTEGLLRSPKFNSRSWHDFKTSILQDDERSVLAERNCITGAIVREDEKHEIAPPVDRTPVAVIKGIELKNQWRKDIE